MSKTSHARHEHKAHLRPDSATITTAEEMDQDFNKHHKGLIIGLVVIMIIMLPLLFAAATLLRMVSW